ncbi:hypothetical protein [Candidatus Carsonella ruddii]|uniref:Uncharacterized protein n=1 Tax=Candidatus Carsonella ruddii (Diaphorina cf. continua) TaxID=2661587 RepID=A0A7R6W0B7_CARRU|nr:hypothetical protein [Candidatus Carsonella ruddii (Diaphorina cf. continua)]BCG49255.1 hypothetical protein CRDco_0355 [Candidatus Carsonella ruddii (Diaphorina cf. continua)]
MFINFIYNKKKNFFLLKKYYHKNTYKKKCFYNFLKRILFKKLKFMNLKCIYIKKKEKNLIKYFFFKVYYFFLKNNIFKIKFFFFDICFLKILIKKSYLIFKILKSFLFFLSFCSKIFLFTNNLVFKVVLLNFNQLSIKYIINKKTTKIIQNILLIKSNNFFIYNLKAKVYNIFIDFYNKIKIFDNFNFSIENFFIHCFFLFIKIFNFLSVNRATKNIFVYQNFNFFLSNKNLIVINLNISLYSKKLFCKHKIFFLLINYRKYYFIDNFFIKKI